MRDDLFPRCARCGSPVAIDPADAPPGSVVLHAACNAHGHALLIERLGLEDCFLPEPIRWPDGSGGGADRA